MTLADKRYAEYLLDVAIKKKRTRIYVHILNEAKQIFVKHTELQNVLKNPKIPKSVKKDILFTIFDNLLSDTLMRWMLVLVDNDRIMQFPSIVENYRLLANKAEHILNIDIITPFELDDDQIDEICERFRQKENAARVRYKVFIDKSLIGGFKVRIDDFVYDFSMATKIKKLSKILTEQMGSE